jgi:hypothetical protein
MPSASHGIGEGLGPVSLGEFLVVLVNPEIGVGVIPGSERDRLQQLAMTQQDNDGHGQDHQQHGSRVVPIQGLARNDGRSGDGGQG